MSENLFATLVTLAIMLSIFVWDPILKIVHPACNRLLNRHRRTPDAQTSQGRSTEERA